MLSHKGLGLSHGGCVQCFTHNGLSDLHAFVRLSAKKSLARVLRIERLDVVVDVLAIAFAIIFWKLGLALDARAKADELNSVWSEISHKGEVIQVHIDIDLEKLPAGK